MKDKTFICKDCNEECRAKTFTPEVVIMELCPQCYTKRTIIIKKINNIKLNEKIPLEELGHTYLKYVYFDQTSLTSLDYETRGKYSWVAETNSMYSHRTIFPMRNYNYVKFFKTLKGAKRNFIKSYIEK